MHVIREAASSFSSSVKQRIALKPELIFVERGKNIFRERVHSHTASVVGHAAEATLLGRDPIAIRPTR